MRMLHRLAIPALVATAVLSSAVVGKTQKPKLKVSSDGWPSGHSTPEGAACDAVRALINRDEKLFRSACVRLYASGNGPAAYAEFLSDTGANIRKEAARAAPSPGGPKAIAKVFGARHLTLSGPASRLCCF